MKVYKQEVAEKRKLLEELSLITWKTRQEAISYLTEIAKAVSGVRFDNIIRSIVTSDMTPSEVVNYLRDIKI